MSQIFLVFFLLLLSHTPTKGGVGRRCEGGSACISLLNCPPLLKLLQPPVTSEKLSRLQQATCDASDIPKVCCPQSQSSNRPIMTTPSTTTTTTTEQPKSSGSEILRRILNHPNLRLLPNAVNCGKSTPVDEERIAGGTDAGLGSFPWMVLIGYGMDGDPSMNQFGCGGTLINSRYVLTAAHCVTELPQGFVPKLVRVGEYNQSADVDCSAGICSPKAQDIAIEEAIPHENYDKTSKKENDIALIRLSKNVAFGPFVSPVCLPHGEQLQKVSLRPWVAGWGRTTSDNPDNSAVLQKVAVPFQSMDKCNDVYSSALGNVVDEGRFCAGGEKGKDSCQGDSGGPLMLALKAKSAGWDLRIFQFGVVSLGPKNCDSSALPALYTKVSHFVPWILDHLKS